MRARSENKSLCDLAGSNSSRKCERGRDGEKIQEMEGFAIINFRKKEDGREK
jgi:hypothetical protein